MPSSDRQHDTAADDVLQLTAALCDGTVTADDRDRVVDRKYFVMHAVLETPHAGRELGIAR